MNNAELVMCPKKILLLLISLILGQTGFSQDKKTKLSEMMKTYHSYNMFDGAVLVAENGEIVYKGAFGLANREWNIPNQTNTKFMIGSVSKPITSTLKIGRASCRERVCSTV